MKSTIMQKLWSSRLFFLATTVLLLVGSCFPSLDWPNDRKELTEHIVDRIEVLRAEYSATEDKTAVGSRKWSQRWDRDPLSSGLLSDYALATNIISARYYKETPIAGLTESSLAALNASWEEGIREPNVLVEAALKGLFANLDPYSRYMTADQYKSYRLSNRNQLSGIGVRITKVDEGLRIDEIFDDSQLFDSDVVVGSIILSADDTPLAALKTGDAIALIKGVAGTNVRLHFKHPTDGRVFARKVERRLINLPSVSTKIVLHDDIPILLVEIYNFNARTADTFRDKIKDAFNADSETPQGIVFDIRNNPGGSVGEVVSMVDWLMSDGMILRIAYRNDDTVFNAHRRDIVSEYVPIAILTNEASASASEIFAGSLQSSGRATVFGDTSFGKTLVQRTFGLSNGRGIKLTIGKYYVFGNRPLDAGVSPNVMVSDNPDVEGDEVYNTALDHLSQNIHNALQLQ